MLIKVKYNKRHERDSNPRSSVYETDKDSIPRSLVYAVRHVTTWPQRYISGMTYQYRYRTFDENKIMKIKYMGLAVRNFH